MEYENAMIRDREKDDELQKGMMDQQTMNLRAVFQATLSHMILRGQLRRSKNKTPAQVWGYRAGDYYGLI